MAFKDAMLAELKEGGRINKKIWSVFRNNHSMETTEKSMTLGRLATHVAEIPHWISDILISDEFDFATVCLNATSFLK